MIFFYLDEISHGENNNELQLSQCQYSHVKKE